MGHPRNLATGGAKLLDSGPYCALERWWRRAETHTEAAVDSRYYKAMVPTLAALLVLLGSAARADMTLLNASYDPTRRF